VDQQFYKRRKRFISACRYPVINTASELQYNADLIVYGKFTGNRVPDFINDDNGELVV